VQRPRGTNTAAGDSDIGAGESGGHKCRKPELQFFPSFVALQTSMHKWRLGDQLHAGSVPTSVPLSVCRETVDKVPDIRPEADRAFPKAQGQDRQYVI